MIERNVILKNIPLSYGASASMVACLLKRKMNNFESDCIISAGDFVTDIRNENSILSLFDRLEDGSEINICVVGSDEEKAIKALIEFLEEYCGEDGVPTYFNQF